MKFLVAIEYRGNVHYEVEAASREEAIDKAKDAYYLPDGSGKRILLGGDGEKLTSAMIDDKVKEEPF